MISRLDQRTGRRPKAAWGRSLGLLILVGAPFALPSCAVAKEEYRPLLAALDRRLPDPDSAAADFGLQVATLPAAIPAGVVDTFVSSPALHVQEAGENTVEWLWEYESSNLFVDSALLIPRLVATPVVFLSDWLFESFFDP